MKTGISVVRSPDIRSLQAFASLEDRLIDAGICSSELMAVLKRRQAETGQPLADLVCVSGVASEDAVAGAISGQFGVPLIDPQAEPPQSAYLMMYGPHRAARTQLLPWRRIGGAMVVLTARPEEFPRHREELEKIFGTVRMALATPGALRAAIQHLAGDSLRDRAETRVAVDDSCRTWRSRHALAVLVVAILLLGTGLIAAPVMTVLVLTIWALFTLALTMGVKAAAAITHLRHDPRQAPDIPVAVPHRVPVVSIIVPLFKETQIAEHLLARLQDIDYPREFLDIHLALEENDLTTQKTLAKTHLPPWIRPIVVPAGALQTKPRALNYTLDFCRGSIVGVYDAEDAPASDQLRRVVARFATSPSEVACLQGVLDYYNPHANWLTRCFTIEYATWFRLVLPGLERMDLPIPLGCTTLFFRRDVLEELGGWDAHNVTEDADLGMRLARRGYRTELIATTTEEEANGRIWPWIKQRSRWLKGYAITYAVHMRRPRTLWRELGPWRFFGMQVLFLGTLSQFVLAPLLWSFWLIAFGLPHPLTTILAPPALWTMVGFLLLTEAINIAAGILAVRQTRHRGLMPWIPTLHLYFPLAALASYKGLWELTRNPFYWDKTAHGLLLGEATPPLPPPEHPASDV
ncbi:glycosyltransferase family 2 protein [Aestuariibius insulae]|uniref:glycosyltransferase family 2 protein n=1 Tax=Aestuariibius insulae TaxID=2058287 RepID=UPI00345E4C4F